MSFTTFAMIGTLAPVAAQQISFKPQVGIWL